MCLREIAAVNMKTTAFLDIVHQISSIKTVVDLKYKLQNIFSAAWLDHLIEQGYYLSNYCFSTFTRYSVILL